MGFVARSALWFPLVGAVVGLSGALAGLAAAIVGIPLLAAAALAISVQVLITGALHEDGWADICDGLGGGRTREDKLRIMRDSRIGTYGALGLFLLLAMRLAAIQTLLPTIGGALAALCAAAALGRAAPAILMASLGPARTDGLGARATRVRPARAVGAGLIALTILGTGVVTGFVPVLPAVIAATAAGFATLGIGLLCQRHLSGHTGDGLGAAALVAETSALLIFAAGIG